jgi:integrase
MRNNADGIYTRKDREGYWMHWTDAQGRRKWRKLNVRTLQQARKARAAELVRVEQSRVLGFAPPGEDTFADVAARFLAHQKARLTSKAYEREKGVINEHLATVFHRIGCQYSPRRCPTVRHETRRGGIHPFRAERTEHTQAPAAIGHRVGNYTVQPSSTVKSPRVPGGRVRYLQPTELRLLLEAAPGWLRPIVALAACTGMRRSEILGLRWLDVDLENSRILLPQTKNGEGRIVYLNNSAVAALRSVRFSAEANATGLVFAGVSPEQVSVAFSRLCRTLKIADSRFHDLRHTAASWLRMKGADIHTVAQLLGHKDLRMAARYQHLSPLFLADAVARLDTAYGPLSLAEPQVLSASN